MTTTNALTGDIESNFDFDEYLEHMANTLRANGRFVSSKEGGNPEEDQHQRVISIREAMRWDDRQNQDLVTMGRWAERFVRAWTIHGSCRPAKAILCGRTGCGKTHLAKFVSRACRSAAITVWQNGLVPNSRIPSVVFVSWTAISANGQDADKRFEDILSHELPPAGVVVIDDFGAEFDRYGKGEPNSRFQALLDACDRKRVFATTNVPVNGWNERFGPRVNSRLSAYKCLEIPDSVPDYRPLKAKQ